MGNPHIYSKKVKLDGYIFDSSDEAKRYADLKLLSRAEQIFTLSVQPKFELAVNGVLICKYTADFAYYDKNANFIVEDCKPKPKTQKAKRYLQGTTNWRVFKLKQKLMKAVHDIDVQVVYV